MRFRIHIHTRSRYLPVDYQYALSAAVYKQISRGDEVYSNFLHNQGFSAGDHRRFKLFTFSALHLPKYKLWKEKGVFELYEGNLSFVVSFMADQAAEAFIKGMFQDQEFSIGDRFASIEAEVTHVEAMPRPLFLNEMHYRCLNPMTVSVKEQGQRYETYLYPDDPRFGEQMIRNLLSKSIAHRLLTADANTTDAEALNFQLLGDYQQKRIRIKPYTREEVSVKGFLFKFSLTAPDYLQELAYYSGFGDNNAMGFGCGEVVY
jgi:CRISPR-associated endoribonuclease Cas6